MRTGRAVLVGALACVVALELTGCRLPGTQPATAASGLRSTATATAPGGDLADDPADALGALLDRRAAALRDGKEAAWLADLDPRATRVVAAERRAFRAMRALGLSGAALDRTFAVRTPATAPTAGALKAVFGVAVSYEVRDIGWTSYPTRVTIARDRRGARWRITSVETALGWSDQKTTPHEPWTLGDVAVVSSQGAYLVGDKRDEARLRRLLPRVVAARASVNAFLDDRRDLDRLVVYVPRTRAERTAFGFGGNTAAVAVTTESRFGGGSAGRGGTRLVLDPATLTDPAEASERLLRHEITHAGTSQGPNGYLPVWLAEGLAEYVSCREPGMASASATVRDAAAKKELLTCTPAALAGPLLRSSRTALRIPVQGQAFYAGSNDAVATRYGQAMVIVLDAARRGGEQRLLKWVDVMGSTDLPDADPARKRLTQEQLGRPYDRLVPDAVSWTQRTLRGYVLR